jgi:predicted RNA-binding protein associated with RNAse of E/G family
MKERIGPKNKHSSKLHVRYTRLPDQVTNLYDDLVYRSRDIVVGRGQITTTNSIVFDGKVVLMAGFRIVHFELTGKSFTVGKIRDLQGRHTGYYCDIVTPPRLLEDGGVELTDLFLDLWVSPDLRYKVLDEDELDHALRQGWISSQLHEKAKKELKKLINRIERGDFPPRSVKALETRLHL